jgi:hypothetical protein
VAVFEVFSGMISLAFRLNHRNRVSLIGTAE